MPKNKKQCPSCGQRVTAKGGVFSAQADVTVERGRNAPRRGTPIHNWRDLITDESLRSVLTRRSP